jgi:superoxide dismutase, Fe-Mn family
VGFLTAAGPAGGYRTRVIYAADRWLDRSQLEETTMLINRRNLVLTTAATAAVAAAGSLAPRLAAAQAAAGPFKLDPLAYATNAFEPFIDAKTMEIHHDRHHQAYVTNLNTVAKDYPAIGALSVQELLAKLGELPEAVRTIVRNNGGGHANHTMFWSIMGPGGGAVHGELAEAITRDFGSVDALQTRFNEAGLRVFGSGWVFVTVNRDGKLALETRPNQDTPLMDGGRVLFGNDVWEHAYYLSYQNRRADYLKAWWNTVSWSKVAERYAAAKTGTLAV